MSDSNSPEKSQPLATRQRRTPRHLAGYLVTSLVRGRRTGVESPNPGDIQAKRRRIVRGGVTALALTAASVGIGTHEIQQNRDNRVKLDEQKQQIEAAERQIEIKEDELQTQADQIARQTKILDGFGVTPEQASGVYLRPVTDLPGYGERVNPELQQKLQQATVKLGVRPKGSVAPWTPDCTAILTKRADGSLVGITANHCFFEHRDFIQNQPARIPLATNITDFLTYELAVLDPAETKGNPNPQPIALVNQVAIDTSRGESDMALLSFTPLPQQPGTGRSFEDFTPLSFDELIDPTARPQPGMEVALYGIPQITGNRPVPATGIYLGYVENRPNSPSMGMDYVGVFADSRTDDNVGEAGSSGSGAVLASGAVLPTLSTITHGFGLFEAGEYDQTFSSESATRNQLWLENHLGTDLMGMTILGFTRPYQGEQDDTLDALQRILANPADVVMPDYQGK